MLKKLNPIVFFLFFITMQSAYAQTNAEKATAKMNNAIKLMDEGRIDESIVLLKEAQVLDPGKFNHTYELAYANYLKKDYNETIVILEKLKGHKDEVALLYQLLGNSYDIVGNSEKAFEIYDAGLKKFPGAGELYLEKGNVFFVRKEYGKALPLYEKGIETEPSYASNYYRATAIYLNSTSEVWGMIYGEIFMNLEPNTARTEEISKLLFDAYKSQIKFTSDTTFSVSFDKDMAINIKDTKDFKLPFGTIYEQNMLFSVLKEKKIDINTLNQIRTRFIQLYFSSKNNEKYPNALFDFNNKILKAGHLEAYNYWLLKQGDPENFNIWYELNKTKLENFATWMDENGLDLNKDNKFFKNQYN